MLPDRYHLAALALATATLLAPPAHAASEPCTARAA